MATRTLMVVLWGVGIGAIPSVTAAQQVMLLDASEGQETASAFFLDVEHAVPGRTSCSVVDPAIVAAMAFPETSIVPYPAVVEFVDDAQRHYLDFDHEQALAALDAASDLLTQQDCAEHGELLIRILWLYAQLAITRGEEAQCIAQLKVIVGLAPWWEPPLGYLTPGLKTALEDERQAVLAGQTHVDTSAMEPGVDVWIDGIAVPSGTRQSVAPGRHLIRVQRSGYATTREWVEFGEGETLGVSGPIVPAWTDAERTTVRDCLRGGVLEPACAAQLTAQGQYAGADLIVVAVAVPGTDTTRSALYVPGGVSWETTPDDLPAMAVVRQIARESGGSGGGVSSSAISPLLSVDLGGAMRPVPEADQLTATAAGLSLVVAGGVAPVSWLEIRFPVGLTALGGARVSTLDGSFQGLQSCVAVRGGAMVGPRLRFGQRVSLWIAGGGGVVYLRSTTSWGEQEMPLFGWGGWTGGTVGLDRSTASGWAVGPVIGYSYLGVTLRGEVGEGSAAAVVSSGGAHLIHLGVQVTIGPGR